VSTDHVATVSMLYGKGLPLLDFSGMPCCGAVPIVWPSSFDGDTIGEPGIVRTSITFGPAS